jgi:hypothetical protein
MFWPIIEVTVPALGMTGGIKRGVANWGMIAGSSNGLTGWAMSCWTMPLPGRHKTAPLAPTTLMKCLREYITTFLSFGLSVFEQEKVLQGASSRTLGHQISLLQGTGTSGKNPDSELRP